MLRSLLHIQLRSAMTPSHAPVLLADQPDVPTQAQLPPAIRLKGISLAFNGATVLEDVNLEITQGEFIALIGPSGGGKSTLLRVIAGLLRADKGTVEVAEQPAVVFQDYRLLPWRTAEGNVALPQELKGSGRHPQQALKQVGMLAYAERYPDELSGGMKARVAIARALAQETEVVLLDEPFAALDALTRERFNLELKRLQGKENKTVLFVTHSIREAVYLADKVVLLRDGRIQRVIDTHNQGRLTAYQSGVEAQLRDALGTADSTVEQRVSLPWRFPWEAFGTLALLVLLLGGWSLLARQVSPLFFPPPADVLEALITNLGLLTENAAATLSVTLLGILCAVALGTPAGYLMARSRVLERLLSPFIVALQAVPTVIIAPLLVLWLGYGLGAKLVVTTLVSIFPVIVSTMSGVREVDRVYREAFQTMGSSRLQTFLKLEVPGALPSLLSGLRLTVTLALIGTVVSEFVFGGPGLGYLANSERLNFRTANAVAAVSVMVFIGLILYGIVGLFERRRTQHYAR